MKRLVIAMGILLLNVSVFSQDSLKNVLWTMRIHVKLDKRPEFEKKLPVFLQTHYPSLSFRVYETITGPRTGSYVVISGPFAFKEFDLPMTSPKGEAAMKADDLALKMLFESYEVQHARIVTSASIPNPTREIKYIQVSEREIEGGTWSDYLDILKKLRVAREKGGSKMDVSFFRPVAGGNINTLVSSRFISKWEDLDMSENLAEQYDNAHGRAAWSKDVEKLNQWTKSLKQEMRVLRKDLSTTAAAK